MIPIITVNELYVDEVTTTYDPANLDWEHVEWLARSMAQFGQINPPLLNRDQVLIVGRHRMEAIRFLEWEKAWFVVVDATGEEAELLALDEDLFRKMIPWLQRCEMLLRRDQILQANRSRAASGLGRLPKGQERPSRVTTADVAREMGVGKRTYQRQLSIARRICPEARGLIRGTRLANSERELESLARVPKDEQVAVAKTLVARLQADDERTNVAAAVHALRRERAETAGGRFEVTGENYKVVQAQLADWAAIVDPGSIALIVTYVPEATGDAPVWDTKAPARYTESTVAAHREVAKMAAQALVDGGSLVVMIGSQGSDEILAAMRTQIDFVDSVPLLAGPASDPRWRSVLWFTWGEGRSKRLPLIGPPHRDSLVFDVPVECLSEPGETVFDPYGHCETATSAVCHGRRYIGFVPTPKDALSLHHLLIEQLEDL